jgi:chemotaxis signal transduction protein
MSARGGAVLRVDGALVFLPAATAATVTRLGKVTRVAGAPPEVLGIVMHEGQVVPVVALGRIRDAKPGVTMIVCKYLGEPIGLIGGEVVEAGIVSTEDATTIDLAEIHERLLEATSSSFRSSGNRSRSGP